MAINRILLPMIVALSWLSLAAAQEPALIVETDRQKIYEGESVLYRITLNNVENPKEPSLKALDADFNVAALGQHSMDSRSVTIINGRMTEEVRRGRQYNYRLTPKRTGTLTIPAPSVEIDGKQLRGREISLTVAMPSEQDVVRMEIRSDRESVYPMQPFTVTLTISVKSLPPPFSARNPVGVQTESPTLQMPWAVDEQLPKGLQPKVEWRQWLGPMKNNRGEGFNINNILDQERVFSMFGERQAAFLPTARKVRLPDKAGKETEYWQYDFRRTFVAKRVGDFTFGPASTKGAFAAELNAEGRPIGENIYAVAKPLVIQVKDAPSEGRPDSYTGAVGTFQLSSELQPKQLKTGDPMTLTLSLSGEGTLDSVAPPDLGKIPAIANHFKIYEATEQTKGDQRQFTYSLRPLDADVREFPAVPVSCFDVDKGSYVTLHTEPVPIEVTKAVRLADRDIVASAHGSSGNSKEIETRREGIFANITDAAALGDESVHPERWLSGLAGLAGSYALLAVGVNRWRRISGDSALLRRRAAAGLAKRRLRESAAESAVGRTREAADRVQAALLGLVADMLDLPSAGLTSAEACRRLDSLGVEPQLVGRLRTLLETCEGVRYGASAGGSEALDRTAHGMLRTLTSALKRHKAPQR